MNEPDKRVVSEIDGRGSSQREKRSSSLSSSSSDHTLNLNQAVAYAQVTRRTIYFWMQWGLLPFTIVRGHRRITLQDLQRVQESGQRLKKPITTIAGRDLDGPGQSTSETSQRRS